MERLISGFALREAISQVATSSERAWLVSGFVKSGFIERACIAKDADLQVFSRWRLADLLGGGSDIDACRQTLARNGSFFIHPRLHAKVFVFDNCAFVGSANLTFSGLPSVEHTGNIEAAIVTPSSPDILEFVDEVRKASIAMSYSMLEEIETEILELKATNENYISDDLTQMPFALERQLEAVNDRTFTGADFPWCEDPSELIIGEPSMRDVAHDLELFALKPNPSLAEVRRAFLSSRCANWLKNQTRNGVRFGTLTASLHDALHGNPRPYRRDVKRLLANLLHWAIECAPETFQETQHRHTRSYKSIG